MGQKSENVALGYFSIIDILLYFLFIYQMSYIVSFHFIVKSLGTSPP